MAIRYGVSDGSAVQSLFNTPEEALAEATRLVKFDGIRRWTVRVVTIKRLTGQAAPPPEPLVEDE